MDYLSFYSDLSKIAFPVIGVIGSWMLWSFKSLIEKHVDRLDAKIDTNEERNEAKYEAMKKENDLRFKALEEDIRDRKKFESDLPLIIKELKEDIREIIRLEVNQKQ